MRNKDLMEQNFSLFEQLQKAQYDIKELKGELEKCQKDILALKAELEARQSSAEPQQESEDIPQETSDKPESQSEITAQQEDEAVKESPVVLGVNINKPYAEYGSEAIGKIVVQSAQYAAEKPSAANLIFGKTEMSKSEIMSIISSEISLQQKKDEIDIVLAQAEEYFKSVAG